MIHGRAFADDEGWVTSVIVAEEDPGIGIPVDPDLRQHPIIGKIEDGEVRVPHDDRDWWRLLRRRGFTGSAAVAMLPSCRERAARLPAMRTSVASAAIESLTASDQPGGEFPEAPGLRLRPFTAADLDVAADVAVEAGIYSAECPEGSECGCRPPAAHAWLRLARRIDNGDAWQLCLEFEGRPLQYELVHLDGRTATVTLTYHLNRERPHWFWRETERPVFERLAALGYTHLDARTRKDRPDWIAALQRNYGAEVLGEWDEHTARLRFPIDRALTRMQGWPARPSVPSPDLRELTPEEAEPLIEQAWGLGHERLPLAKRLAREWYYLDRAAILAAEDGIRIVRTRDPEARVASVGWLTPMRELPRATPAVEAWLRGAGYIRLTSFVPEAQYRVLRPFIEGRAARPVRTRAFPGGRFVEVERDL